jgi:hypothetical protein
LSDFFRQQAVSARKIKRFSWHLCCSSTQNSGAAFAAFTPLTNRKKPLAAMLGSLDRWLGLAEIAKMFGLSEESIKRLAKSQGFPLRRLTPYAMPGALESELLKWLKAQPPNGKPVRHRTGKSSVK